MNSTFDNSKTVDINDIIIKYVKSFPFPKDVKQKLDLANICYEDIEDSELVIDQETVEYTPKKLVDSDARTHFVSVGGERPKSHVVFSCLFKNQTSEIQENTLETSRETRSTTNICMSKSVLKEGSFNLQLQAPNSLLQANAGFKKSVTIDKRREYSLEETLHWTANSKVIVRPGRQVKAELLITEDEINFDFKIQTTLSGRLKIFLRNRKTGYKMDHPLEINDLSNVFLREDGFTPNENKTVSFICFGTCYSRFGISQNLNLVESSIESDPDNKQ